MIAAALFLLVSSPALPPGWWSSLESQAGLPCCDGSDGENVLWEADATGTYRIFLFGKWVPVPPSAIVTVPNLYGLAVVWLDSKQYANGALTSFRIRCFMSGAGT